jgi:uncharacterized protein
VGERKKEMKPNVKITRTADGKEQRSFTGVMELRAAESEFAISGTAVGYNVRSSLIGGQFYEVVAPGAFNDTLQEEDQVCCFNHDANQVLGRKKSGTLTLQDSPAGLKFRCQLDRSNPAHQSVYAAIKRGDIDGCSFQFTVPDGGDTWAEDGRTILRTLRKVKLYELGPVTFPAYPQGTSVGARAERRSSDYVLGDWRAQQLAKLHAIDTQYHQQLADAIGRQIAAEKD